MLCFASAGKREVSSLSLLMYPIAPHYGSDPHGLVWGYHFRDGQPGAPISCAEAGAFLAQNGGELDSGDFLWLHFSLSNTASPRWLREHLELPESFYESIASTVGSTRVEQESDALVAVIHDVLFDFSFDASEVATSTLCIMPNLLVSVRLQPLRSLDLLRADVKKGYAFDSSVALLAHLLQNQASVLLDIQRKITAKVDRMEDEILANQINSNRAELGSMRRLLVRLQRLLAPEPAALFRLLNRPPAWVRKANYKELQHAAEEFSATIGDSTALVERIKLLQEELSALVSEQSNRTLFVLTIVTVLALPINLVAGLFGMNVGGLPFSESPHGFGLVVTLLVMLTAGLAYLVTSRLRDRF